MTSILVAAAAGAVLFAGYGLFMWRRAVRAGRGCACGALFGGCGSCPSNTDPRESEHVER